MKKLFMSGLVMISFVAVVLGLSQAHQACPIGLSCGGGSTENGYEKVYQSGVQTETECGAVSTVVQLVCEGVGALVCKWENR